jgi:hypothetical protein
LNKTVQGHQHQTEVVQLPPTNTLDNLSAKRRSNQIAIDRIQDNDSCSHLVRKAEEASMKHPLPAMLLNQLADEPPSVQAPP